MYAGLRRGELMALKWTDLDLAAGVIRVERSWDIVEGPIELKTHAGRRKVPIAGCPPRLPRRASAADWGTGPAFGGTSPFIPRRLSERADGAWEAAGLDRITLHECRHTFASLMIAAGVNAKALSTYIGHANIGITLDRYGHLMPGNEEEAAGLLNAYLAAWDARARGAEPVTA